LEGDAKAFARFVEDPEFRRYLGPSHPHLADFMANNLAADGERELSWVIEIDGEVVGSIFLGVRREDATAELACLVSPAVWGQGIAREAGRAVVDFAFRELQLARVWATADAENLASRRAMERSAMTPGGSVSSDESPEGSAGKVMYELTRATWEDGQGGRRD
jgi:RimJ/RimL family protein N-acetyltransferase